MYLHPIDVCPLNTPTPRTPQMLLPVGMTGAMHR